MRKERHIPSFLKNIFDLKKNTGIFWNEIDEAMFKEEISKVHAEFKQYLADDMHLDDPDFLVFDESEAEDLELYDNFYYPIDIYMNCVNWSFVYTNREFYFFFIFFLFLLYMDIVF